VVFSLFLSPFASIRDPCVPLMKTDTVPFLRRLWHVLNRCVTRQGLENK
jgi:hypothetical protein